MTAAVLPLPAGRAATGGPQAKHVATFRAILSELVTPEVMRQTVQALIDRALEGNLTALRMFLGYLVGKPGDANLAEMPDEPEAAPSANGANGGVPAPTPLANGGNRPIPNGPNGGDRPTPIGPNGGPTEQPRPRELPAGHQQHGGNPPRR